MKLGGRSLVLALVLVCNVFTPGCGSSRPQDPNASAPADPNAGVPADPNAAAPADPNAAAPADPNAAAPSDPSAAANPPAPAAAVTDPTAELPAAPTPAQLARYNSEPVQEQYRVILGREATPADIEHFASVLLKKGEPIAWYAPYNQDGIKAFNATEFQSRGGVRGVDVTALYRTRLGRYPTLAELQAGVEVVRQQSLDALATQIGGAPPFSWSAVSDVMQHQLARAPNPGDPNDVSLRDRLAAGTLTMEDVIHQIRSTAEYAALSGPSGTQPGRDPHLPGEFIRQIYRFVLRREPTTQELQNDLAQYPAGFTYSLANEDGDPRLVQIADRLQAIASAAR